MGVRGECENGSYGKSKCEGKNQYVGESECVCVCVCVRVRGEGEGVCVCVCLWCYIWARVSVWCRGANTCLRSV